MNIVNAVKISGVRLSSEEIQPCSHSRFATRVSFISNLSDSKDFLRCRMLPAWNSTKTSFQCYQVRFSCKISRRCFKSVNYDRHLDRTEDVAGSHSDGTKEEQLEIVLERYIDNRVIAERTLTLT